MKPTVVLMAPNSLSQSAREHIGQSLREWDASGRPPVVLDEGMQMSLIGGIGVRLALTGGPLDGVTIQLSVATLDDLPESLDFETGVYRPLRTDHDTGEINWSGVWHRTVDGNPVYSWWIS